jgi:peptidyl-prolyl cis-trans isomerase C
VTVVERAKRLAREPLVHFLVVGALIFAVWGGGGDAADRSITVTEAQVRGLTEQWEQQWHRQPAPAQVDGLIRDLIKDEVYYREAVRLGLDKDDIIMRRRMRSKMEFLIAAQAENEVPSDAALQNWLDTHRRDYATNAALSFDHIYVGNDVDRARRALAQLDKGADPAALTSPLSVPPTLDNAPAEDIDRQFGDGFAKAVAALPPGRWAGPVVSGFGQHLVRLRKLTPGALPPLASVRKAVENDWREANRTRRENGAYQALLDGYTIRIAKP